MPETTTTTTPAADAPAPGVDLELVREAIFRGAVQWTDDELDEAKAFATARATFNGLNLRRVVDKRTRVAGYAIVDGGTMRDMFAVADPSGVYLTPATAKRLPNVWLSDRSVLEAALVARAERDRKRATEAARAAGLSEGNTL